MMTGWTMLFYKEVLRFWKVSFQTVAAPVLTAVMYLMIFGHVLEEHVQVYDGVSYTAFLIPGLVMMSVLQNAFANSSSSMVQSKIMGNLVFLLLTPLSHWSWFFAYALSAMVRGVLVGAGVLLAGVLFVWQSSVLNFSLMPSQPVWVITFAVLGALMLGTLGLIAGLWADKLFHPLTAELLAERESPQPVLLHDRWFPLWLFWSKRCIALVELGGGGGVFNNGVSHRVASAAHGLQDSRMKVFQ
jgi:ABC-type multidrug transport system permease subunit